MALVPASSRGGPPSGAAGGDLTGTFPNPTIAPAAVTAAKLSSGAAAATTVATADGAGGTSYAAPPTGVINSATLDLTAAQIKALNTTPIQIVAAPGATSFLVPLIGWVQLKFGTVPYAVVNDEFDVIYAGDTTTASLEVTAMLVSAASTLTRLSINDSGALIPQATRAGKALQAYVPTANPTLGDSVIRVVLYYATFALV